MSLLHRISVIKFSFFNGFTQTPTSPSSSTPHLVCKGVPASPFLRHPPLEPTCPLFKIFVSPPLFSVPPFLPLLRYSDSSPHPHATFCPNPAHQPSLHVTGVNKYQKVDFTSSTVVFHQKSIFDFLNPFTNRLGYLNL